MQTDRFLRIVLVVIALELLWIGLKDFAPPVTAQTAPMRVIISGVDGGFLPVALAGRRKTLDATRSGRFRSGSRGMSLYRPARR